MKKIIFLAIISIICMLIIHINKKNNKNIEEKFDDWAEKNPNSVMALERSLELGSKHHLPSFATPINHMLHLDLAHEEFIYSDTNGKWNIYGYYGGDGIKAFDSDLAGLKKASFGKTYHLNRPIANSDIYLPGFAPSDYRWYHHNCQNYVHDEFEHLHLRRDFPLLYFRIK